MLLVAILYLIAGAASAQNYPGMIGIYSAEHLSDHCIEDRTTGVVYMYVAHVYTDGATASRWALQSDCNQMIYIGESSPFATVIGNSQTGISIGYTECLQGPILLTSVAWFGQGTTPECCEVRVVPDPTATSGAIEAVDCNYEFTYPHGGVAIINTDPALCPCHNPVKESTWGGIKALYR
jgi:hypothetical protein